MPTYKHTQIGYLILAILFVIVLFYAWLYRAISAEIGANYAVIAAMALAPLILASFATLKVAIDGNYLRVKFGYGVFRKKFLLSEITSANSVKNHWYYGWGIRFWLRPRVWIYNVSGFDAVEITMKNGRVYRIGTDVPAELEAAIKMSLPVSGKL